MFQPSKRLVAIAAALLIAAVGYVTVTILMPLAERRAAESTLRASIESDAGAREEYRILQGIERAMADEPQDVALVIAYANGWHLIADLTGDPLAREKAIAAYEEGIARFGATNTVLIMNAGNTYRAAGRLADAEAKYRLAIEVNPGDPTGYERLIDLYRIDMGKGPHEILPIYRQALDALVDNVRIVQLLAGYLVDIGRYTDALSYYELLEKRYPDQYRQTIAEVRAKAAATSTP